MMNKIFKRVIDLIKKGEVKVSSHGYDELAEDNLLVRDLIDGVPHATVVEEYPDYFKGPCVLVFQRDHHDQPVHVVWGIPKDYVTPAVLITAYRPDPKKWTNDFLRRKNG